MHTFSTPISPGLFFIHSSRHTSGINFFVSTMAKALCKNDFRDLSVRFAIPSLRIGNTWHRPIVSLFFAPRCKWLFGVPSHKQTRRHSEFGAEFKVFPIRSQLGRASAQAFTINLVKSCKSRKNIDYTVLLRDKRRHASYDVTIRVNSVCLK